MINRAAETSKNNSIPVALFIDGDNQKPNTLIHLTTALLAFRAEIVLAVVAGNDNGHVVSEWRKALEDELPQCSVEAIEVACTPDAADVELILAMGRLLDEPVRPIETVVFLSRDHILHAAAEAAAAKGLRAVLAWADGATPSSRSTTLPTLLLPGAQKRAKLPVSDNRKGRTGAIELVRALREKCKAYPNGDIRATDIGQALREMGYRRKSERDAAIAAIPRLRYIGTGSGRLIRLPAI